MCDVKHNSSIDTNHPVHLSIDGQIRRRSYDLEKNDTGRGTIEPSGVLEKSLAPAPDGMKARRGQLRLVANSAGDRMKAGVSDDGKALRNLLVGRPLDVFGKKLRISTGNAEAFGMSKNRWREKSRPRIVRSIWELTGIIRPSNWSKFV
jgi:hypothetical protein